MSRTLRFTTFAAPPRFHALTARLAAPLWIAAAVLTAAGVGLGLAFLPVDAVQGHSYRILFLHVPAAWLSMVLYLAMAGWAVVGWTMKVKTASVLARAIAPTGALFTAIALVSGAIWGKPTWGTWWVWDARLTSELLLLFLFLGWMALVDAIDDPAHADAAGAVLALVGAVNIPVIHFSVVWWNTLHQGASITLGQAPRMAMPMLVALALATLGAWAYAFAIVFARARAMLVERERDAQWVAALVAPAAGTSPAHPMPARGPRASVAESLR